MTSLYFHFLFFFHLSLKSSVSRLFSFVSVGLQIALFACHYYSFSYGTVQRPLLQMHIAHRTSHSIQYMNVSLFLSFSSHSIAKHKCQLFSGSVRFGQNQIALLQNDAHRITRKKENACVVVSEYCLLTFYFVFNFMLFMTFLFVDDVSSGTLAFIFNSKCCVAVLVTIFNNECMIVVRLRFRLQCECMVRLC